MHIVPGNSQCGGEHKNITLHRYEHIDRITLVIILY